MVSGPLSTFKRLPQRIGNHNVVVITAGLAFYGLLALVPTLIATISIYGLVNQGNEAQIKEQITEAAASLDGEAQAFIVEMVTQVTSSGSNGLALVISVLLALFSASGGVQKLMTSVSLAYETKESRKGWKVRILAYLFTVGAILGFVLMVVIVGVIPATLKYVDLGQQAEIALQVLQLPMFLALYMGGLTVLYRYAPDRQPRTPWKNPGALVAGLIWVLFALAFTFYSNNIGGMPASYGFLGSVAALMIFLQLTAFSVVVGAEYNAIHEEQKLAAETEATASIETAASAQYIAEDGSRVVVTESISFGKALVATVLVLLIGRNN